MDYERLFSVAGNVAMIGWAMLVFLPRWRWTTALVTSVAIPALLAVVYGALIASQLSATEQGFAGFGSLAGVKQLFQHDGLLLAGWIHYLAFDLFVGSWEVRDARRHQLPHLAVLPCLFLTLMLGPVGLLCYFVLRGALRRKWTVEDQQVGQGAP